jgi:hypothetical protein
VQWGAKLVGKYFIRSYWNMVDIKELIWYKIITVGGME